MHPFVIDGCSELSATRTKAGKSKQQSNLKKYKMTIKHYIASLIIIAFLSGLSTLSTGRETQAELKAQAKITQAEAEKTALTKVPDGKIKEAELENERGILIWSFDISMPSSKSITEVQVDAKTGKIVSTEVETPEDQAKESAADKKEKK
jgi:uncharacterized membrane protein YkoI